MMKYMIKNSVIVVALVLSIVPLYSQTCSTPPTIVPGVFAPIVLTSADAPDPTSHVQVFHATAIIPQGANNGLVGRLYTFSGFSHSQNNSQWQITASDDYSMSLVNSSGLADTGGQALDIGYVALLDSTGTQLTMWVNTGTQVTDVLYGYDDTLNIFDYVYWSPLQDAAGASGVHTYTFPVTNIHDGQTNALSTWLPGTNYSAQDAVTFTSANSTPVYYVALQPSTNQQPDISPTYWKYSPHSIWPGGSSTAKWGYYVRLRNIVAGSPCLQTDASGKAWYFTSYAQQWASVPAPAGSFDYMVHLTGPANVYQGQNVFFNVKEVVLSGSTSSYVKTVITGDAGLLSTSTIQWFTQVINPGSGSEPVTTYQYTNDTRNNKYQFPDPRGAEFEIDTSAATPTGTYTIKVNYCDGAWSASACVNPSSGTLGTIPAHSDTFTINVVAPASFTVTPPAPTDYTALPDLTRTGSRSFGVCDPPTDFFKGCTVNQAGAWEDAVPYYMARQCANDEQFPLSGTPLCLGTTNGNMDPPSTLLTETNVIVLVPVTATLAGTIPSIVISTYPVNKGTIVGAIYDSDGPGGTAGTLLCQNSTGSINTSESTLPLTGCPWVVGHTYFLATNNNNSSMQVYTASSGSNAYTYAQTCCSFPSSLSGLTTATANPFRVYVNITPSSWVPSVPGNNCSRATDGSVPYAYLPYIRPNDIDPITGLTKYPGKVTNTGVYQYYYDYGRAVNNWKLYTGTYNTWDVCNTNIQAVYRDDWALQDGNPPAPGGTTLPLTSQIQRFPDGLYIDWLQNGQLTDQCVAPCTLSSVSRPGKDDQAIDVMGYASQYSFSYEGGYTGSYATLQREMAQAAVVDYYNARMHPTELKTKPGLPSHTWAWWVGWDIDHVENYLQQACNDHTEYYAELFMLGVAFDFLEREYAHPIDSTGYNPNLTGPVIKARMANLITSCTDWLDNYYSLTNQGGQFPYSMTRAWFGDNHNIGATEQAVNGSSLVLLDALVLPYYGFSWSVTGNPHYKTRGDGMWSAASTILGDPNNGGISLPASGGQTNTIGYGMESHPVNTSKNGGKQFSQWIHASTYLYYRFQPGSSPMSITTTTLPNATVGIPYSQSVTGTGGLTPYTFLVEVGSLPAGLTITPNSDCSDYHVSSCTHGLISGTPTTAGTQTFKIGMWGKFSAIAEDAVEQSYTLTVNASGQSYFPSAAPH